MGPAYVEETVGEQFYLPGLTFSLKPETHWSFLFSPSQLRVAYAGGAYLWYASCG